MKSLPSNEQPRSHDANPGLDLLRAYAGHIEPVVHVERQLSQHRTVFVQRDALGRIVGSTEQVDETTVTFIATDLTLSELEKRGGST